MSQSRAERREDPNRLARFGQFSGLPQLKGIAQRNAKHSIKRFEPADIVAKNFRFL
jgi:hypothetical protein